MTGIAWDGEKLVADKAMFRGEQQVETKKVHIVNGHKGRFMLGLCGTVKTLDSLVAYFNSAVDYQIRVYEDAMNNPCGLAVDAQKLVRYVYPDGMLGLPLPGKHVCDGAAMEFLYGAMAAGSSAEDAIKIALTCRSDVGMGYDVLVWSDVFDDGTPWPSQPSYQSA